MDEKGKKEGSGERRLIARKGFWDISNSGNGLDGRGRTGGDGSKVK